MTRQVSGDVAAALAQPALGIVLFVEMLFDAGPLRVCSAGYDLAWDGKTWNGLGQLGTIEEARESESGEVTGLAFTLSGVASSQLALALQENYQRRVVNVFVGFLALPAHTLVNSPMLEWSGLIDTMTIVDGGEQAAIRVTAENELFDFARPAPLYWTDEDQRKLYPGDTGLRFAKQLEARSIVWPAAEFFHR